MAIDVESRTSKSAKVVCASTNIPTGFSHSSAASLVLTGIAYAVHLAVINETTSRIAINYTHGDATSSPTTVEAYVPAGGASSFSAIALDELKLSSTVFIKSDSGSAISSGTVELFVW